MEPWELAARRYKQLVRKPIVKREEFPAEKLQDWLRREVCRAVEDVIRRPRFQEYAGWPIAVFAEGADSEERKLLDRLCELVPAVAATLVKLLELPKVIAVLKERYPSKRVVAEKSVRITSRGSETLRRGWETFDEFSWLSTRIKSLSRGKLGALVDVGDYFSPLPEIVETDDGEIIQRGETIPTLNFRLHPVGDFVAQAMFVRIEPMMDLLQRVSADCQRIGLQRVRNIDDSLETLREQHNALESTKRELEERLTISREARLRNSCVILTQIYAAFHVKPDLSWLELPDEVIARGAELIRQRFTGWQNAEMADRIAAAVTDLGKLYSSDELILSDFDEAIANRRLVLSRDTQEYYWDQSGPIPLKGRSWDILLALADCARGGGRAMREVDVYVHEAKASSTFPTAVGRCLKKLPTKLAALIETGVVERTYRLGLRRDEIKIF